MYSSIVKKFACYHVTNKTDLYQSVDATSTFDDMHYNKLFAVPILLGASYSSEEFLWIFIRYTASE